MRTGEKISMPRNRKAPPGQRGGARRPITPQLWLRGRGCGRRRCGVFLHLLRRRRSCSGRRVGLLHLIGRRRGCGGRRVGLLHFVMLVVLCSGIGRLSARLRRRYRILAGRGGGARLSGSWILCRCCAARLCGALCHYRQGQGEYNQRAQNESKWLSWISFNSP